MRKVSLLEALYSWDEFWKTIETAWEVWGDPRPFTQDNFIKWLSEKVQKAHGGWFAWPMPLAPLAYMSEKDIDQRYSGQLPRGWGVYDHAHRVMDWLGFAGSEELAWWLFAYVGGDMQKLLFFIQHRSSGMIHEIVSTLGLMGGLVQELSTGRMPYLLPDACPPVEYGPRSPLRKPKYSFFDLNLISPKHRQGLIPEPLDPFTIKQRKALAKYLKHIGVLEVEYNPAKELEESQLAAKAEIRKVLEHPIYKILNAAKFRRSESTSERLGNITKLTRLCHEGQLKIEELLEWNWKSEQNKNLRLELGQAARVGQYKFRTKRRQVANKIYKQVHGWFRRRGWAMPKCAEGWRNKTIKLS